MFFITPDSITLIDFKTGRIGHLADKYRPQMIRYRTILQTAMDGFWLADTQGRLLEVNDAYCRMSGYSARELLATLRADPDWVLPGG